MLNCPNYAKLCYVFIFFDQTSLTLLLQQKFAMSQRGGEPSAASGLSPAKDSGGKCTYYGAQEVPLTATAGV